MDTYTWTKVPLCINCELRHVSSITDTMCDKCKEEYKLSKTIKNQGPCVRRNMSCPCGSGKKAKKCHLMNNQQCEGPLHAQDRPTNDTTCNNTTNN